MKKLWRLTFLFLSLLLISITTMHSQSFVYIQDGQFQRDGKPYYFLGTNFWYGMNLASKGEGGDRERLVAELDHLQALGITNLRIVAGSEGPDTEPWRMKPALQPAPGQYNEALWDGLDFLLDQMSKRGMTAVVCLNNFYPWSGGFTQYYAWAKPQDIPYPPPAEGGNWFGYMTFATRFYKEPKAIALYENHIRKVIERVNCYNDKVYKDDPTIMSWELANEPRGMLRFRSYRKWIKRTARLIKSLDKNHLVTIGSEGNTSTPTGNHFTKDHGYSGIDYTTVHIWIQNWQWYDPKDPEESYQKALDKAVRYLERHLALSKKIGKPMIFEEFGIARDNDSHEPSAPTKWRDQYYQTLFEWVYQQAKKGEPIGGCNFWAWGGQGRPRTARAIWQAGDDFIGDPPHEHQGWYSVYDRDTSTLAILAEYGRKFSTLSKTEK